MKAETDGRPTETTPERPSSVRSDDWFDDDWEDYEYAEEDDCAEDYCRKCGDRCGRGILLNGLCPMCYECTGGMG